MSDRSLRDVDTLLLDLDDTLYDYAPAERVAREVTLATVAADLDVAEGDVARAWSAARAAVKERLGARGAAHSRLLYLIDVAHRLGKPAALPTALAWNALYWNEFTAAARLRPGALPLLKGLRRRGGRVAIVTDLVADVQLKKLEVLGLAAHIDALVVSEEVPEDKPASAAFLLALERLGSPAREHCLVAGDSPGKDGEGARRLGLRYFQVRGSEAGAVGESLERLIHELGLEEDT